MTINIVHRSKETNKQNCFFWGEDCCRLDHVPVKGGSSHSSLLLPGSTCSLLNTGKLRRYTAMHVPLCHTQNTTESLCRSVTTNTQLSHYTALSHPTHNWVITPHCHTPTHNWVITPLCHTQHTTGSLHRSVTPNTQLGHYTALSHPTHDWVITPLCHDQHTTESLHRSVTVNTQLGHYTALSHPTHNWVITPLCHSQHTTGSIHSIARAALSHRTHILVNTLPRERLFGSKLDMCKSFLIHLKL